MVPDPALRPSSELGSAEPSTLLAALLANYDDLVGYVQRRFGASGLARDVVHEACLQILARPAKPAYAPLGLLRRMLHNLAVDHCRRRDVRQSHELSCAPEDLPDVASEAADPARALDARREFAVLVRAIESLPERCREVFVLHKIHGLPQAEVAALLHVSTQTIEKHLRRGVQACCAQLSSAGYWQ